MKLAILPSLSRFVLTSRADQTVRKFSASSIINNAIYNWVNWTFGTKIISGFEWLMG